MATAEKRKRTEWNDAGTAAIIEVWGEHLDDLRRVKRNRHVYQDIVKKLQDVHGVTKSLEEVKNKLENLSKQYKKEKQGGIPSTWKYYESVHQILGSQPSESDQLLAESVTLNDQELDVDSQQEDCSGLVIVNMQPCTPETTASTDSSVVMPPSKRWRSDSGRRSEPLNCLMDVFVNVCQDLQRERADSHRMDRRFLALMERQTQLQEEALNVNKQILNVFRKLLDKR